jgi:hypothetical protein
MVYEELRGDIEPFLKLYKLVKIKGMGIKQVVNLLKMSNNDLPDIEERFKRLRNDTNTLQVRKHTCERNLDQINNKIALTIRLLNSLRTYCDRERREMENLCNEKVRKENLVTQFKNNNEEYLDKIKHAAHEEVKSVLNDGKLLLKFANLSVIESLRTNPELFNFIVYSNSNETAATAYGSNYLSLISEQRQQSFNDNYTALILEEAEKLYNKLTTKLTNRAIAAADAGIRAASLPLPTYNNNRN